MLAVAMLLLLAAVVVLLVSLMHIGHVRGVIGVVVLLLLAPMALMVVARAYKDERLPGPGVSRVSVRAPMVTTEIREQMTESINSVTEGVTTLTNGVATRVSTAPWTRPQVQREWPRNLWAAVSVVVLGVMIFLGYLFLDSGTRGQFTWTLRIAAVVGFVGICILLLALHPGL
jgi:hypothetical protein